MVIGRYRYSGTVLPGSNIPELFDGNSWTTMDPLPIASFSNGKAVLYKEKIILTGGDVSADPRPSSWIYDIATGNWSMGFEMSPPISRHNSFLVPKSFCKESNATSLT